MVHKLKITDDNISQGGSTIRRVSSQVIACMTPNLLLLDLGLAISFATICVPELLNATEGLSLDSTQASWFGSLSFLTQPLGAVITGPLVDYFGRKKANFLANIPHLIAWTLLYFSWNLPTLFIGNALLGFGTGVMEAPINAYVGEISEPSLRGALCTVTQLFTSIGVFVMYFLGTVVHWRTAAAICLFAPIMAMILVLQAPDTPVWLLVQGREKDAMKSLCYLRGWTTSDHVREEFDDLSVYVKKLEGCVICEKTGMQTKACPHHKISFLKRWGLKFYHIMFCKETMRPLTLVICYFIFYANSGLYPVRPNMVNVCGAFGMADDGKNIVLMVGVITFMTAVLVVGFIKLLGKRKLALSAMLGCALSCTALSVYARHYLDRSVFTYDTATYPKETSYVPLVFFYLLAVFTGLGIPWVILGEVFPFRSRATAQGIAAAANYVAMFVGTKTFINLEQASGLCGVFAVYAVLGYLGTIFLYFLLPETEGKTLQEIEVYYSGEYRTFADDPFINYFKRFKKKL